MAFLSNLFKKSDTKIESYADFWTWFQGNEKTFHKVIKQQRDIERNFFDKISPKLAQLKEGFFFLTGMLDDNTVELVLTADGIVKNFVFVEELVAAAPSIPGWKFTAHKPELDIKNVNVEMSGFSFSTETLTFHANTHDMYPDEIDITVMHRDFNESNKSQIANGTYIFLDNVLGELAFAEVIDNLNVVGVDKSQLKIEMHKLKSYLDWRQKEFLEKYEGVRYGDENDPYATLEGTTEKGQKMIAIVNAELLKWDRKASHPWILAFNINYKPAKNGMPDDDTYQIMNEIEDKLNEKLTYADGYLNVGRETCDGIRTVYFACKDFRKSSRLAYDVGKSYSGKFEIDYDLYKDKYWRTFNRFDTN